MTIETSYSEDDLTSGKCSCCGEKSDEIQKGTTKCIDCIEEQKFFDMTMQGVK